MALRVIQRSSDSATALPGDWHPVVRRVLAARGVRGAGDIDTSLRRLPDPAALSGGRAAAERIAHAVMSGERILVVGDFDADGATSCAVAVRALQACGAARVEYLVPNRFEFGYGLSPEIVAVAARRAPDLLITVDQGIACTAGVAAANDAGIPVIVTDHHLPGDERPAALAIVNPNQAGDAHPGKALAGVGVIFHVMLLVRAVLRERAWFAPDGRTEPNLAELLDLVAVGTVADVVPLDGLNRMLVEQGLRRIRAGRAAPGVRELLRVAGRTPERAVAADLAFAVGPRLNAAGRLEDMTVGIECLLADAEAAAAELAAALDRYNRERREIETRMRDEALATVETLVSTLEAEGGERPSAFCLSAPDWHEGVIGIVAGRVKDHFHRPVVAFAPTGDGTVLKGSARSVSGLHMRDLLDTVSRRHPGLIPRFGGHAMAAGLSLPAERLEAFRAAFEAAVTETLDGAVLTDSLYTDGPLEAGDFTLDLAERLRAAAPWGQGFPEPVFDNRFDVLERRIVGDRHLKLRVRSVGGGPAVDAIAFHALDRGWDGAVSRLRLAYRLDVNEFRGRRRLQLVVEYLETTT